MECESKVVLKGSNFRDRMFIKLQKNRKLIKEAAKAKDWPKTKDGDKSGSDPEYEVGEKRKKNENDEGMEYGHIHGVCEQNKQISQTKQRYCHDGGESGMQHINNWNDARI